MSSIRRSIAFALLITAPITAQAGYENAFAPTGEYPSAESPGFHENVQGVTHDDTHWYFTQKSRIWRIPVAVPLDSDLEDNPLVKTQTLFAIPDLLAYGFDHFGDADHYHGYLVVPVTGPEQLPQVAVFRAADLAYVGRATLWGGADAAFLAVSPNGRVWCHQGSGPTRMLEYTLDWSALAASIVTVELVGVWELSDESGAALGLPWLQGGTFSPSGDLLYLVNGNMTDWLGDNCPGGAPIPPESMMALGGIHVIETQGWVRTQSSTNGHGLFNYEFHPGGTVCEEPEGLTWWDLDGGAAPGISGQLHVLLLDNDWPDNDDIYFKHYTNRTFVSQVPVPGTPSTVGAGADAAWDGSRLLILTGDYDESLTIDKRVRLESLGGTVRIGEP